MLALPATKSGQRRHPSSRRARAQFEKHRRCDSARPDGRHHRTERVREIDARFRYFVLRKVSADFSTACRPMRGNSSSNWKNRTSIWWKGCRPASRLSSVSRAVAGKSTVATVTEVYHFLRLLFAKTGTQFCPDCNLPVEKQTLAAIVKQVEDGGAPWSPQGAGTAGESAQRGFTPMSRAGRSAMDSTRSSSTGSSFRCGKFRKLERFKEHTIDVVVGVIDKKRIAKARNLSQRALEIGRGTARLIDAKESTHGHEHGDELSAVAGAPSKNSIRACSRSIRRTGPAKNAAASAKSGTNRSQVGESDDGESVLENELGRRARIGMDRRK